MKPRTQNQAAFYRQLEEKDLLFGVGPAGCGKTFLAVHKACEMLDEGRINKIIVTRPMIDEEDIGSLPGDAMEKFAPYFAPVKRMLVKHYGTTLGTLIKKEVIEIAPLAFLRGHTFENGFVILDEAQNTTEGQMKLFLTRIGENVKVSVTGDLDQISIRKPSGLDDALHRFSHLDEVGVTYFTQGDVVRSALAKKIVAGYK